jgi:uncharacterized protein with beta-barrel porin domain
MSGEAKPMAKAYNLDDIRAILSDEIQRLRSGESTPAMASAVTNAAGKILSSISLEIKYQQAAGRAVNVPMLNDGNK